MEVTYFGAALAGLLSFLSPCVLPLVPPYLCYLGGTSLEQLTDDDTVAPSVLTRVVAAALCFVLGFSTVFIALGAAATSLGQLLNEYLDPLAKIGGVVIIILGLHFLGIFKIPLLYREKRYHAETQPATLIGAYVIGLAFAFGWTPCIGPVLAAILAVAAGEDTVGQGVRLLTVYSMGLGIPFVLAAFAMRPFLRFMQGFRRHLATVEKVIGGLLVGTGVMFVTGSMGTIAYWLIEAFPGLSKIG